MTDIRYWRSVSLAPFAILSVLSIVHAGMSSFEDVSLLAKHDGIGRYSGQVQHRQHALIQ